MKAGAEAGSSPDDSEEAAEEAAADPEAGEEGDEYANLPFGKHPRFQEVLGKVKDAEARATAAESDAERYRNVETFLANNGLTGEDAAAALEVQALAKANPVAAWEKVRPWVQQLAIAAGAIVPPEMRQRVERGELTDASARELAAAQARATAADQQRALEAQRLQQQQAQAAQQAVVDSVSAWEADRKLRDPNFTDKYDALQREVAFLQQREGRPRDIAGVRAQLDKAYEAVSKSYRPAAPAPQKKAVRPVTGGQSAGKASAAPQNTMAIIDSVVGKG